tara:strand:- start:910 stop:1479 length:570 start_codon:yes stop_codon:yes gene_type:complete
MKLIFALFIIIQFMFVLTGCGTMQAIDGSKSHSWNVEVKASQVLLGLDWRSLPDFEGSIVLEEIDSCTNYRFYSGAGFFNNKTQELQYSFKDLKPLPWYPVEQVQKANELLGPCDFFVFQKGFGSDGATKIQVVNEKFETVKSYQLERRESVPLKDWPFVSLAFLIDIPVVIITAPLVIIGAPFWYFSE